MDQHHKNLTSCPLGYLFVWYVFVFFWFVFLFLKTNNSRHLDKYERSAVQLDV